jgi:hypothetical protein
MYGCNRCSPLYAITCACFFFSDDVMNNRRPSLAKRKSVHMDVDATQGEHTLHTAAHLISTPLLIWQYSAAMSSCDDAMLQLALACEIICMPLNVSLY